MKDSILFFPCCTVLHNNCFDPGACHVVDIDDCVCDEPFLSLAFCTSFRESNAMRSRGNVT